MSVLSPLVRQEYYDKYHSTSSVQIKRYYFCSSCFLITAFTIWQIKIYSPSSVWSTLSSWNKVISPALIVFAMCYAVGCVFHHQQIGSSPDNSWFTWLAFINTLSLVKLGLSICKYLPQLFLNFTRRSTKGWSIGNVLLDFTGGLLSTGQQVMDCAFTGNWIALSMVIGKNLVLGSISILYDIFSLLNIIVYIMILVLLRRKLISKTRKMKLCLFVKIPIPIWKKDYCQDDDEGDGRLNAAAAGKEKIIIN